MQTNKSIQGFGIVSPTKEEQESLNTMDAWYEQYSDMTNNERQFVNALILRYKPSNCLELGVAAGGASVVLLNALNYTGGGNLTSIDLSRTLWKNNKKLTGWCVDHYPELKKEWNLYTGDLAFSFMDDITDRGVKKFDFCLIDTVHKNPGEILDFLMIYPYLSENALVVFHDISAHIQNHDDKYMTNCLLMSAISGKLLFPEQFAKIISSNCYEEDMVNIGGVIIDTNLMDESIDKIFNLLSLKWNYRLSPNSQNELEIFFKKHYGDFWSSYFHKICEYQKRNAEDEHDKMRVSLKIKVKEHIPKKFLPMVKRIYKKIKD